MIENSYSQLIGINQKGELLFQHRTSNAKRNPGKWDLFGGGMEGGEDPEQALRRELIEELELSVDILDFYRKNTLTEDGIQKHRYYFIGKVEKSREELLSKLHEGQGLNFLDVNDVDDLDLVIHHKEIINGFISELKSGALVIR